MENVSGFCDLCVLNVNTSNDSLIETCRKLISLGYKTIAINYTLEDTVSIETKKKKKKGEAREPFSDVIPPPIATDFLKEFQGRLQIFHRLTIKFSDPTIVIKLVLRLKTSGGQKLSQVINIIMSKIMDNQLAAKYSWQGRKKKCQSQHFKNFQNYLSNQSVNIKKYNLIAALPTTQNAFQYVCSAFDVDVITFDSENKNTLKMTRKLYNQAINRGLFFEIMYTPAIKNSKNRKNIIQMSHLYHAIGKSKHIIISSWASDPIHVRGPYDIINLGLIFGLSEDQAKRAISSGCRDLIIKAEGRRHGKSIMLVKKDEDVHAMDDSDDMSVDDSQHVHKKVKHL